MTGTWKNSTNFESAENVQSLNIVEFKCELRHIPRHKGSLRDEDDAQTLNTCIAQRKCTIPHSTMENNGNVIEWYNNTRQGAPHTGKQTCTCVSDIGDSSHIACRIAAASVVDHDNNFIIIFTVKYFLIHLITEFMWNCVFVTERCPCVSDIRWFLLNAGPASCSGSHC